MLRAGAGGGGPRPPPPCKGNHTRPRFASFTSGSGTRGGVGLRRPASPTMAKSPPHNPASHPAKAKSPPHNLPAKPAMARSVSTRRMGGSPAKGRGRHPTILAIDSHLWKACCLSIAAQTVHTILKPHSSAHRPTIHTELYRNQPN